MTDPRNVEHPERTRRARSTPSIALQLSKDRHRSDVRSATPDSSTCSDIDTIRPIIRDSFDLAIVEEGTLSKLQGRDIDELAACETPVLCLSRDPAAIPADLWAGITDAIRADAGRSLLAARIQNTMRFPDRGDRRQQYGLVGIDCIPDPAVSADVVDGHRIVRHANSAFETEFGFERGTVADESLDELIVPDVATEFTADLVDRALDGETVERVLRRDTRNGRRDFLVRMMESQHCRADLWITYADVTGKRCREQQVQVLNRVLRHNLRNDMNVILGNVDRLRSDCETQQAEEAVTEIRQAAQSLVGLGDTASSLRLTWDEIDPTAIDLVQVAHRVRGELRRDDPSRDIRIATPDSCWARGDSRLVTAVTELVENALEHTPTDTAVEIRVEPGPEWVRLSVTDTGQGLPDSERAVLNGDTETPLDHGSGLGLWIVNWIVSISGGRLDVDVADGDGTTVTISLPSAELDSQ